MEKKLASDELRTHRHRKQKTILVVDDSRINRAILARMFVSRYRVLEAENGVKALQLLREDTSISVVVLDLMMPEMDGFEVLRQMQQDEQLALIPVIVVTVADDENSQIRALNYGAQDVIGKPVNPDILQHRVDNMIAYTEAIHAAEQSVRYQEKLKIQAKQLYLSQHDRLTDLYNRNTFVWKVHEVVMQHPPDSYLLSCLDLDGFKVVNDRFGHEEGDRLLRFVADTRRNEVKEVGGIACRDMADLFLTLLPNQEGVLNRITEHFFLTLAQYKLPMDVDAHIGRYVIDEPELDVNQMIDRALMAVRAVKGSANTHIGLFDAEMRKGMLREQELAADMRTALVEGQFVLHFQPQYNYETKRLTGAEALVRWEHPQRGLLSPIEFIPLFERNGFISALDGYVWEKACACLREWMDRGLRPVPLSVNISRRDIRNPDLPKVFAGLIQKYRLSPEQLHLEITESAYMDQPKQLIQVVEALQAGGFTVEMDDFGTGYSSLNILKDVPVDILKLDMKFSSGADSQSRGGRILSSVVRMAHWLNLTVVAEGVETVQQADFLKSIGCLVMQGYLFSKPVSEREYRALLAVADKSQDKLSLHDADIKNAVDFLDASSQATLLFNSFVGGAYIAEFDGSRMELLRANDRVFELLGCSRGEYHDNHLNLLERFYSDTRAEYVAALKKAVKTGKETQCELHCKPIHPNGKDYWTMNRIRFLAENRESYVFYISVENITRRKELERSVSREAQKSAALIANLPGGAITFVATETGLECEYFSDGICRMLGYSREEIQEQLQHGLLRMLHPDDKAAVGTMTERVVQDMTGFSEDYRLRCASGSYLWMNLTGHPVCDEDGVVRFYCVYTDITERMQ